MYILVSLVTIFNVSLPIYIQVIAFLYTAMRSVDLGLRTALVVTPVNVLHNWKQEFVRWAPSELKSLRIFMLGDVSRYQMLLWFMAFPRLAVVL